MFRKLLFAIFLSFASFSVASAEEGRWRQDRGRGWHYQNYGQNYYWIGPTEFAPAAYYWWDELNQVWVVIERKAFYATPYSTSYGYYSPYPGWIYSRGGKWVRDDKRGGHNWDRGDWQGRRHTDRPAALPERATRLVPKPKEEPAKDHREKKPAPAPKPAPKP